MSRAERRLRPWMLVSAAWIVPAMFAAVNRVAQGRLNGEPPTTARDLVWASGDWLLYAFLTPAVFAISRRLPLARPHLVRRASEHLGISLLFCVAWATAGKLLELVLTATFDPQHFQATTSNPAFWTIAARDWIGWVFITLPFGVAVYLCVVGVEHAVRYFTEARERDMQLAKLSEQLSGARLAALQAQLNPHFLFNSLNTVTVLVRDGDTSAATRVIEQLSDVLRRTLNRRASSEVALEEELDLAQQYLAVEQARFSDRLTPEFHIAPTTRTAAVPSFAVQHLVENAVRHGIARRTDAGRVIVTAQRDRDILEVTVEDDGAGIGSGEWTRNHGLSNTAERLRTLYGDRATLAVMPRTPHGTTARLRIPYHEMVLDTREANIEAR